MTLFEINAEIESCIDMETGEILAPKRLESLQLDRHEKLRNIAFVALNAAADIAAYKEMEQRFKRKRAAAEKIQAWAKETLARELNGQKMKEKEFSISYLTSEVVEIDEGANLPSEFLKEQKPTIDKAGIKAVLKDGAVIPGCRIVSKQNIQIK